MDQSPSLSESVHQVLWQALWQARIYLKPLCNSIRSQSSGRLEVSVTQAAHVAKEAEGSGPNDAASKPEIAASSMDAIQRLDDDDDDHSRPQLAHVLSRSSQASHSHCSSSLWPGLGAEKLMQFLNAEASPG